jgi:voltage-gated potassium channel
MTMEIWRKRSETPLMVAAVLFLAAYTWRVLDPNLSMQWRLLCDVVLWSTWALFAIDYIARLALADSRAKYFIRHLHDLAVVALPVLRPLRLLRIIALLGVLNQIAGRSLRGRVAIYVTGGTVLVIFLAALAVLDAERYSPGAQITTFSDALWWAAVSTTTVGYGDLYPVTGVGRLTAGGLMIAGIALVGTVTASLASWLIENIEGEKAETALSEVEQLAAEVRQLRQDLAGRSLS